MKGKLLNKNIHGIQEVDGSIPFSSTFYFQAKTTLHHVICRIDEGLRLTSSPAYLITTTKKRLVHCGLKHTRKTRGLRILNY